MRSCRSPILGILLFGLGSWEEVHADPCAAALTVSGRNELLQVSESDRRALFYRQLCKSEASDTGITFEYAKAVLGFSHSNKQQFCDTEKSQWESYQFDYLKTSTVVEKALDSWLACIRLTRSGILLTPKIDPARLTLTLERASKAKGIIRGVSSTAGTKCRGHLPNGGTKNTQSQELTDSISYQLPVDEAWTVICDRQSVPSQIQSGASIYPETTITLDTTEGGFSVTLDEAPLGSEKWADVVASEIDQLRTLSSTTDRNLADLRSKIPTRLEWRDCTDTLFLRPWGPNVWHACPDEKIIRKIMMGAAFPHEFRFECCRLFPIP